MSESLDLESEVQRLLGLVDRLTLRVVSLEDRLAEVERFPGWFFSLDFCDLGCDPYLAGGYGREGGIGPSHRAIFEERVGR